MPVPAYLVLGALGAGKTRLVQSLLAHRPEDERWAVLVTERGAAALAADGDRVAIREASAGCLCCTGAVTLRVELGRLVREIRPDRLVIEAGGLDHIARRIRVFDDFWLAQTVKLARVFCAIDADQLAAAPPAGRAALADLAAAGDTIVVGGGDGSDRRAAAGAFATLHAHANARIVHAGDLAGDAGWLAARGGRGATSSA